MLSTPHAQTKSSHKAQNRTTKAIVKSIHTLNYDPYLMNLSRSNNNNRLNDVKNVTEKMDITGDDVQQKNVSIDNEKCDINSHHQSSNQNYENDQNGQNNIELNKEKIHLTAASLTTHDIKTGLGGDNSSEIFFVMHDTEKENQHNNDNGPHNLFESPYELLLQQQQNVKSINLNLVSPEVDVKVTEISPSTITGGISLPTSTKNYMNQSNNNSTIVEINKSKSTQNLTIPIQLSPIRSKSSINREEVREYMKKQQEQRKVQEIAKKNQNEKEKIKARLDALKKTTRNLVKTNVEKKLHTSHRAQSSTSNGKLHSLSKY